MDANLGHQARNAVGVIHAGNRCTQLPYLNTIVLVRVSMTAPTNQGPRYKSTVEECDVGDRAALVEYRAKREEWLQWYELRNDEPNSIEQQIFSMIFLDMVYRILAEPRRNTNEDFKIAARSGLLAHFLDQGYVATQILAIRRLLDKRGDVISVRRMLDDICKHRHLLTREIYVCYDGLPYDPDSWRTLPQTVLMQIWGIRAPGLGDYLGALVRHEAFDRLSGVLPSERKRSDLITDGAFDKLTQWLETSPTEKLITLSHKFLAHAADMDSRGTLEYSGVMLADVEEVHRSIIRVERAITDQLLFIGVARDVVPMTPLGFLQGLDSPFVSADSIANMQKHWEQLANERNRWPSGISGEL